MQADNRYSYWTEESRLVIAAGPNGNSFKIKGKKANIDWGNVEKPDIKEGDRFICIAMLSKVRDNNNGLVVCQSITIKEILQHLHAY